VLIRLISVFWAFFIHGASAVGLFWFFFFCFWIFGDGGTPQFDMALIAIFGPQLVSPPEATCQSSFLSCVFASLYERLDKPPPPFGFNEFRHFRSYIMMFFFVGKQTSFSHIPSSVTLRFYKVPPLLFFFFCRSDTFFPELDALKTRHSHKRLKALKQILPSPPPVTGFLRFLIVAPHSQPPLC